MFRSVTYFLFSLLCDATQSTKALGDSETDQMKEEEYESFDDYLEVSKECFLAPFLPSVGFGLTATLTRVIFPTQPTINTRLLQYSELFWRPPFRGPCND